MPPSPLCSIARTFGEDARGIVHNRPAFLGGLGGVSLFAVLAYVCAAGLAAATGDDLADAAIDDAFELEFSPGTIARLGEPPDDTKVPQKIVTQDRRAPDSAPDDAPKPSVSRDDTVVTPTTQTEPKPRAPDAPRDDRDPRIPIAPKPTHANTPFPDDVPTVDHDIGTPLGDADGWSDLMRDGDPWATAVMKALTQMEVAKFARRIGAGDFRFQLKICKDGKIADVLGKGGSLSADDQAAVRAALEVLEVPKPTAEIAASMPTSCVRLKYTFVWTADGVE